MFRNMDAHVDQDLNGLPNIPSSRYRKSDVHDANYEDGHPDNWIGKDFEDLLKSNIQKIVGFWKGNPKIYTTMYLDKCRVNRTRLLRNKPENPKLNASFHVYCAHQASTVTINIKYKNPIGSTLIGRADILVASLLEGEEVDRLVEILDKNTNPVKAGSEIHVKLQYFDVNRERNWGCGIKSCKYPGVPYTFFPQRQGCRVSLYQDAHVPDNFIPRIALSNGSYYEPHRCWEDVFDAITNAKHFIYITGWSVYTEISLIRDLRRPKEGGDDTLGELLKKKSREGVRVLMLVWDDPTSFDVLRYGGYMGTHGNETRDYFESEDSEVNCTLCKRNADDNANIIQHFKISSKFSHHQKLLIVDSELPNGDSKRRRVVSFVGGLDLCHGRYDSPFHPLFRTLDAVHYDDFHQPNFNGSRIEKGGPREPWHDIHSRLEGEIAWDVLYNFEQRWKKQGGRDILVNFRELGDIFIPPSPVMFTTDEESWNVQLFRSIDSGSAFGFPETPKDVAKSGLVIGKHSIIDRSIQDAYIYAIRRAKNFIYIESQYFLGSSFGWKSSNIKDDAGALHLIPKELSLKIVKKIEAGKKFTVYVVLPMWPEGKPKSDPVQEILDWQRRTMEMMYKDIIQALKKKELKDDPRDYLTFFCLGNREVKKDGEYVPPEEPEDGSNYRKAQEARRFMIYVHSKMIIVDDEYIIVGSANINQRSMDGARDTEIAMGAYQPHHIATETPARGQIYGFRMALWYEHLGLLEDIFRHPGRTECVKRVNQIAENYWDLYSDPELTTGLPGHLLRYPIDVNSEGIVTGLHEFFPDTKAPIRGAKSKIIPKTASSCQVM